MLSVCRIRARVEFCSKVCRISNRVCRDCSNLPTLVRDWLEYLEVEQRLRMIVMGMNRVRKLKKLLRLWKMEASTVILLPLLLAVMMKEAFKVLQVMTMMMTDKVRNRWIEEVILEEVLEKVSGQRTCQFLVVALLVWRSAARRRR